MTKERFIEILKEEGFKNPELIEELWQVSKTTIDSHFTTFPNATELEVENSLRETCRDMLPFMEQSGTPQK